MTPWKDMGRYGTVGIELIVSMALGYYAGRALDARIGGRGWITFIGFLLGVAVGFRSIFATARHMQKDIERAEKRQRGEDPWAEDKPPPKDPGESAHDDGEPRS